MWSNTEFMGLESRIQIQEKEQIEFPGGVHGKGQQGWLKNLDWYLGIRRPQTQAKGRTRRGNSLQSPALAPCFSSPPHLGNRLEATCLWGPDSLENKSPLCIRGWRFFTLLFTTVFQGISDPTDHSDHTFWFLNSLRKNYGETSFQVHLPNVPNSVGYLLQVVKIISTCTYHRDWTTQPLGICRLELQTAFFTLG